jgi:hypothetical protein
MTRRAWPAAEDIPLPRAASVQADADPLTARQNLYGGLPCMTLSCRWQVSSLQSLRAV